MDYVKLLIDVIRNPSKMNVFLHIFVYEPVIILLGRTQPIFTEDLLILAT